jgi:hypothetical protein
MPGDGLTCQHATVQGRKRQQRQQTGVDLPGGRNVTLRQGSASAYAATQRTVDAGQVLEGAQGQVTLRQKSWRCRHAKGQQGTGGCAPLPLWQCQNLAVRQWRWDHCR